MRTTKVTETLGFTINLGNYESARVDVSVEIEATSDEDTVRSMHEEAQTQVRQELWESIQPFVGNWSPHRKQELAQRLGVYSEELLEEVADLDRAKAERAKRLGL